MKKKLGVFGSTGSIGTQTLSLVRSYPDFFEVTALAAGTNAEALDAQIREFHPKAVFLNDEGKARALSSAHPGIEVYFGPEGLKALGREGIFDLAVQGIVGFSALAPTLEIARRGITLALANKETLVAAGALLKAEVSRNGGRIIPVDSEHNALFQLMNRLPRKQAERLVLTASGGPFWNQPDLDLMAITPERAVRHPNWKMGPKISVDSATLMNKGLELIEASYLFDWEPSHIDTWIHPQSLVHGAIWLNDGSCQLQLSLPDMRSAIGFALSYPERLTAAVERPSLSQMGRLDFLEPDHRRFPGIALARAALSQGEGSAIALNAANEVAVQAFLDKRLAFPHIFSVVENVLKRPWPREIDSVETVYTVDHDARRAAKDTF